MLAKTKARGIEHEYSVVMHPPDAMDQRKFVDLNLLGLRKAGVTSHIPWSLADEVGNHTYEVGISRLWTGAEGPFPQSFNGMRIYNDSMHFEISSPVYADPWDAVIYSRAGELLVYQACCRVAEEIGVPAFAYKNNVSTIYGNGVFNSVAFGTHGNMAMSRQVCDTPKWLSVVRSLVPYMVARIPLIGAGEMVPMRRGIKGVPALTFSAGALGGDEVRFVSSPRAFFLRRVSSLDTTLNRGLLNTRDEPHANPELYWRLHDINLEGIRCDFQLLLVDLLQTYVMAALEEGLLRDAPELRDPVGAAVDVASDVDSLNWTVLLRNGRQVNAVRDLLHDFYLERVGQLISRKGSPFDKQAFQLICDVVDKLISKRLDSLVWGLDWVTKKSLVEEYGNQGETSIAVCNQYALVDGSVRCYTGEMAADTEYDSLFDPAASLAYARQHVTFFDWEEYNARLKFGLSHGPRDTREYLRGRVIRKFESEIREITWGKVFFKSGQVVSLDEPLQYSEDECKELADSVTTVSDLVGSLEALRNDRKAGK